MCVHSYWEGGGILHGKLATAETGVHSVSIETQNWEVLSNEVFMIGYIVTSCILGFTITDKGL